MKGLRLSPIFFICSSEILTSDLMSKKELIQKLETDNKQAEETLRKTEELNQQLVERYEQLLASWDKVQANLNAQKVELSEIRRNVKENEKYLPGVIKGVITRVSAASGQFVSHLQNTEAKLKKVFIVCCVNVVKL